MPDTAYAQCGDLSLAYQVFGDGEIELVFAGSFVSHVELTWTRPEAKTWFDQLGSFCRVLLFDKAGVGLSDPVPRARSIEDRAAEIEAVMDAAGFGWCGDDGRERGWTGCDRVRGGEARPGQPPDPDGDLSLSSRPATWSALEDRPEELAQLMREKLGAEYEPSAAQVAQIQQFGRNVRTSWGSGEALRILLPSARARRQLGVLERSSERSGNGARDHRGDLPARCPPGPADGVGADTRRGRDPRPGTDPVRALPRPPYPERPPGRGSTCFDHAPGSRILTGSPRRSRNSLRGLTARHLDGTAYCGRCCSATWSPLQLARQRSAMSRADDPPAVRRDHHWELAERFRGNVVESTGDGHLATFEGPTQAIRYAEALRTEAEALEVEIRVGIHTGECELIDDDIGGIAVHIAARVMSQAAPAEILVLSPVRDLVVGSGIGFEERGAHELKGIPGQVETARGRLIWSSAGIAGGQAGRTAHTVPADDQAAVRPRRRDRLRPGAVPGC